jgi:hypothetical protein
MNNAFQISTTYRLDQLEKKVRSLEESLSLLGQKQLSLEKVSDHLVKSKNIKIDIVERPVLEVSKDLLKASKSRKKEVVAERWAVWEKLDRQGFKSGWTARAERRGLQA